MNWYKIFYWLTVADNFKHFFIVGVVVFSLITAIPTVWWLVNETDMQDADLEKRLRKWIFWATPFMLMFWFL